MEKVTTETVNIERKKHSFYCDKCNEYLGSSEEFDDGYYPSFGEYYQSFYVNDYGWCRLELHLCDKCKVDMTNNIIHCLNQLGFNSDPYNGLKSREIELLGGINVNTLY